MTAAAWAAYALITGAALGLTFWLYLRREPTGRGRPLLAGLRGAALALVLLLLFDPDLPARSRPADSRAPRVLLDASASMALPRAAGGTESRWTVAVARARQRAGRGPVLLFGSSVRPAHPDSLDVASPADARSQVLPALRAAAEAGARSVVVVTDGGLEDAAALPGWLARLGLQVRWELVGERLAGAGLQEVTAPAWAAAGEPIEIEAEVSWGTDPGPARRLLVRQDGRVIAEAAVAPGSPNRVTSQTVRVSPAAPPDGATVRLDVSLEPGDAMPADDHRSVMVDISAEPAGIVLVSVRPDWEPRFLLPVLERALGLPARGFLQSAPGVWTRLGGGDAAGRRVPEGEVARAASRADLLVLHAPTAAPAPWLARAAASTPRLLVLATGPGPVPGTPLEAGASIEDDWFAAAPVPASPVAALLAEVETGEAPPLAALLVSETPVGAWSPLLVAAGRRGGPLPAILAGRDVQRRWAVALGQGYWRWAFHGGEPRRLYDHLWSALAGWLVADGGGGGAAAVRPARRVLPRGAGSEWVAAGLRPDSIRLRARAEADGAVVDTLLTGGGDVTPGPVLAPGAWRYQATAYAGAANASGAGDLFVEGYSPELARPIVRPADVRAARPVGAAPVERSGARPLHESAVPWILVVLLLATEWVLRRRWGLR